MLPASALSTMPIINIQGHPYVRFIKISIIIAVLSHGYPLLRGPVMTRFSCCLQMLELAPWTWQGAKAGVYDNAYADLDTTPVTYHYGQPVDPTEYQNEYIVSVLIRRTNY